MKKEVYYQFGDTTKGIFRDPEVLCREVTHLVGRGLTGKEREILMLPNKIEVTTAPRQGDVFDSVQGLRLCQNKLHRHIQASKLKRLYKLRTLWGSKSALYQELVQKNINKDRVYQSKNNDADWDGLTRKLGRIAWEDATTIAILPYSGDMLQNKIRKQLSELTKKEENLLVLPKIKVKVTPRNGDKFQSELGIQIARQKLSNVLFGKCAKRVQKCNRLVREEYTLLCSHITQLEQVPFCACTATECDKCEKRG